VQFTPESLYEAALQLPENQRLDLAARLMDTVPPEIMSIDDPELIEELDRRFNDGSPTIPWSKVRGQQ
jgi:hypothetical protein